MKDSNAGFWLFIIFVLGVVSIFSVTSMAEDQQQYPDPLLTLPGTPEVINSGLEADGFTLGVMAYTWGYPLVRMERIAREYTQVSEPLSKTSYRAPLNKIGWARELATPSAKDMPTANNDTLYMSSIVLLDQPYLLSVPEMNDRYYVVDVFNMWHELEHYIGRRTTGTHAGKYVLVPPGWKGELPQDATRLDVSTDKVWLWGRMRVIDGENVSTLHSLQDLFTLVPLGKKSKAKLDKLPEIGDDPYGFLYHLAFGLKFNEVKTEDLALFSQLERIGLTKGNFDISALPKAMKKGLAKGLVAGPKVAVGSFGSSSLISRKQGWDFAVGLDDFGFNYPFRSMIAGPYLGGQGEKEAIYPIRFTDSEGAPLVGKNKYVVKFKGEPPVNAFWSITLYNAEDKMLVENEIKRYKFGGDNKGFVVRKDGYFEIPVQHKKPEGEFAANWLPAPEGAFYLLLRLYQPEDVVLTESFEFPIMDKID